MSIVGDDHTAAPDGPQSCVPDLFLRVGRNGSEIVELFQINFPVAASRAETLPRNVQHAYVGLAPVTSSYDDNGT